MHHGILSTWTTNSSGHYARCQNHCHFSIVLQLSLCFEFNGEAHTDTAYYVQSSLAITLSPGGIFWDRIISEARYRFCRQGFYLFIFLFYLFFNLVYIFWLQIALSLCTLPRCTFTTHYVYCIFIRICFIALSKRNQNRCPKQVGFCLCSASHWRRSMTVLAKRTTPLALCCLRSVIKVSVSKAICSQKIYTRLKKKKKLTN